MAYRLKILKRRINFSVTRFSHLICYCNFPVLFCIIVCKDAERESKSGMCKSWAKSGYCEKVKYVMSRYCPKECKYCSKSFFSSLWLL